LAVELDSIINLFFYITRLPLGEQIPLWRATSPPAVLTVHHSKMAISMRSAARPAPRRAAASRALCSSVMACRATKLPEALLFDCDGVLVDTEKDGHRVSFNEAFKRKGAWRRPRDCPRR
jgi:hypothetical protein